MKTINSIKPGDIVWLKSGGPKMTVKSMEVEALCRCIWFQHGEVNSFDFEVATLTKSDPLDRKVPQKSEKIRYAL